MRKGDTADSVCRLHVKNFMGYSLLLKTTINYFLATIEHINFLHTTVTIVTLAIWLLAQFHPWQLAFSCRHVQQSPTTRKQDTRSEIREKGMIKSFIHIRALVVSGQWNSSQKNIDKTKKNDILESAELYIKDEWTEPRSDQVKTYVTVKDSYTYYLGFTHLFPMYPLSSPWKHQKTLRFFDVFRGRERVHWEQMS